MYNPLTILMWKHFTVRLRRFIQTPVELVSPILLFVLFFAIKDVILSPPSRHAQEENNNIKHTEEFILEPLLGPSAIIYTPETEHTARLMDEVGREMNIPRLVTFPAADREIRGYYGFTNDTSVDDFIKKMKESQAIVIFQDMVNSFPDRLNYTIRMKVDYMTRVYESLDDDLGPHERFGVIYESFMRLQWAIDKSYLQMRTGNMINQTISLQEFPYVESRRNLQVEPVCVMVQVACFFGLFIPFVFLMARLLEERATGVQELTKMAGVSSTTLAVSHFLNAVPTGLSYCVLGTVLLKVSSAPLIPESNGFLIFVMLALHFLTVVGMAFVCSFLTKRNQYVVSLAMLSYIVLWLPVHLVGGLRLGRAAVRLAGLLPHAPMYWFWQEVLSLEKYGDSVNFSTWSKSHSDRSGSVLECFIFMVLQILALTALTWYLTLVCPGPHGTALPWNFCWKKKVSPDTLLSEQDEPMVRDPQYFEDPPRNKEIGIKIANVDKVFEKDRVLTNVSLDVYKGEITVLLGHNGAGKTTLMSIITGMLSATEGKVYVNGLDTATHQTDVRKQLGLCTQHNLFFADFTVLEHVMFFSMLKGRTFGEARKAGHELLTELGIDGKAGERSCELSGGMQRRLQLACALAGGADVLVLDEPTSGLDVETRRELWDLLLSLRGERTVLLTTHFMEEADALGDRVAALHHGVLRCHATPMHLKKHIGTGYRLSLVTTGAPRQAELSAAVTSQLPDATLREAGPNSASFNLPAHASHRFPHLFRELEAKKAELGIDSIGVGMPTLEEVFLKLCSNVGTSFAEDEIDSSIPEPTYNRLSGIPLYARQVATLITRNVRFIRSTKTSFMILQVILPVLFVFMFTYALNLEPTDLRTPEHLELDLDLYRNMHERKVLYSVDDPDALRSVVERYKGVEFVPAATDVAEAMLLVGHKDMSEYTKYLAGIELNDTNAKVLYTTVVRHAAPAGLNLLSNMLAAQAVPWADGRTVATYNHPVGRARALYEDAKLVEPKDLMAITSWIILLLIAYMSTIANTASLACRERASGTRHVHVMSGCSPALYWLTRLLFHALLYCLALVVPILVAIVVFEAHSTLNQPQALGSILLILTLGLVAWLAFIYLLSFHLGEGAISGVLAITLILGVIAASIQTVYAFLGTSMGGVSRALLLACQYLLPPHTLTAAMLKAGNVARLNAYCVLNREKCSPMLYSVQGLDVEKCCVAKESPASYFEFKNDYPATDMIILCVQAIVYMILVVLTEHGLFSGVYEQVFNRLYRAPAPRYDDRMVRAEKAYVNKAIAMPKGQISDAMLVNDIHKNYVRLFQKSCNAVQGVSFSVKKGECFGLLGVNGAGKSTTFKMIVAEIAATRGKLFANGQHLKCPKERYLHTLGYCPQFFGLDEFLTGKQNLTLLLTLRGLNAGDVAAEVEAWIKVVGLERYKDIPVSSYSGGCKRRMAAAAALCNGAPLTLLDEPTSGVDVSARRRVWSALRRGLRHERAIILTSHSMDEMEALCGRIGIMSGGAVCAVGAPAALRAAHAAGHAVVLKVGSPLLTTEVDGVVPILSLKNAIKEKFNCILKDEHKTMLHYHINETMQYSDLFARLEELKASYGGLIEDYTVTETTLEEVFLSFAQDALKGPQNV